MSQSATWIPMATREADKLSFLSHGPENRCNTLNFRVPVEEDGGGKLAALSK
jgi:hypothetical protein